MHKLPAPGPARVARLWLMLLTAALIFCPQIQAQSRDPRWAVPVDLPRAENFYRLTPNLYRAAQPTAEAFEEYEKFGIKTVVNLRSKNSDRKYLKGGTTLNLIEVPMKAWDISDEEVIAVLRLIKSEPGPILIHCQHGADRTGAIAAMYRLVFENWTKAEALDELINGGYGFHKIWKNIPEYIENVDVARIKAAVETKNT